MDDKKAARRAAGHIAREITAENYRLIGQKMCAHLLQTPEWQRAQSVFCFYGTRFEPDTRPIMQSALNEGKKLYLPRCKRGQQGEMDIVRVLDIDAVPLCENGLYEPQTGENAAISDISLVLVPCLCACANGVRLGHGGGYYDRFLSAFTGDSVLLCPEALLFPALPTEPHDKRVPRVLSENGFKQTEESL